MNSELLWTVQKELKNPCCIAEGDIFVSGSDTSIIFTDLLNGNETYYCANNKQFGDGVSCITGHKTLSIFAFAELCVQPRIIILTYPEFVKISVLEDPVSSTKTAIKNSYINLAFSETEHLISLSGMPDYYIQIWSWRSATLLVSLKTNINLDNQLLRCSPLSPLTICQLSRNTGAMNVWEVHGSFDMCKLINRRVKMNFREKDGPYYCVFGIDGIIYLMIGNGNVYQISTTSCSPKLIIEWPGESGINTPCITSYKGGLLLSGPDSTLKYFKRQSGIWNEITSVKPFQSIIFMRYLYTKELIIGVNLNGAVVKIYPEFQGDIKIDIIKEWDRIIKYFSLVNPLCEYIVTVNSNDEFNILKINDGKKIIGLKIPEICSMTAHPTVPVIAMSSKEGILYLMSLYNIDKPYIMTEFHICHNAILKTIYTKYGNVIVLHDELGDFYLIKGFIGDDMRITHHIKTENVIIDFTILENQESIFIIGITTGHHELESTSGTYAIHINVSLTEENNVLLTEMALPGSYTKLCPFYYSNDINLIDQFYAIPFLSQSINLIKMEGDINHYYLTCVDSIPTIHQLKHVEMHIINEYIITWGIDGIVSIYDLNTKVLLNACMPHHRRTNGIQKVRIDPLRKYVVSKGHTGNLVCTLLKNSETDDTKYLMMKQSVKGIQMKEMFKRKMQGFIPIKKDDRWIDVQRELAVQLEIEKYKIVKQGVLDKLDKLKQKLHILLDKNEKSPKEEQLYIQAFNLDTERAKYIMEFAKSEREFEEKTMKNFIISQNKITNWIKSTCWNTIMTKGTKIRGVFTKLNVDNYALINKNSNMDLELYKIRLQRSSEYYVSKHDIFLPWKPQTTSNLEINLIHQPQIYSEGENANDGNVSTLTMMTDSDISIKKIKKNQYTLTGTSGHNYVKPIDIRYHQLEVVTFQQMFAENIMGYHQNLFLREYFNKKFNELKEIKHLEIFSVKQRNERLRYIQSELNILSKLKGSNVIVNREIIDPLYYPDEKPESIVTVEDWEVAITRYISPSVQEIIDLEEAKAERIRIAMLADDFRERALIKMMDGVLEIRWEEEIKKLLPLPECVESGKDPKDYDQDDLREIQEYDEKMKCLFKERERYRLLLEEEEKKLQNILDEQILKFNFKVGELTLLKMRVESAICQEDLKLLRNSYYNFQRLEYNRQENNIISEMKKINQKIGNYHETLRDLEQKACDCRTEYENLVVKDRLLDRQFKSNFADTVSRSIVDQVYKIFKRRPRWHMRAWATSSILFDLSKRIINKNSETIGAPLPQECFDFLHLIDQLDSFSHAPNSIDEQLWQILCRMRRIKMESEFKLKGCGLQLAEADATTNAFVKEINTRKIELTSLENKLDDLKDFKLHETINRTIQLVIKRGMVEISLSGHISDFEGSILLHISDVHDINKVISKAGMQKLKTMQNAAIFRRKIISKEWEHQVLKMTVRDMKDAIKTIDKCKITKEVQLWLKQYSNGWTEDLSQSALNREKIGALKSLERLLKENEKVVSDFMFKIKAKVKDNLSLDKKIQILNVNVTEQQMARDVVLEEREERYRKERMFALTERAKLVRLVQHQHAQIMELSTMLELQRLRTFPTLNLINPIRNVKY